MAFYSKSLMITALAVSAFFGSAIGQEAPKENLILFGRPTVQVQQTPDITARGVKEKRWTPRQWLEVELPFKAAPSRTSPDTKIYESLTFKYYVVLDPADKSKRATLTADVTHVNVPINKEVASVVYISPGTIERLTGSDKANDREIKAYGVEVSSAGTLVGFFSSTGKSFWKDAAITKDFAEKPGFLLTKPETPFAPLWGDYHCEVQKK